MKVTFKIYHWVPGVNGAPDRPTTAPMLDEIDTPDPVDTAADLCTREGVCYVAWDTDLDP